jgi:hypothetical protein
MNPAGKGYGGRSKLPDNLTQLFRSVAMSVPDNDQIGQVILSSEGCGMLLLFVLSNWNCINLFY